MEKLRILCVGDVVGATGRAMFQKHIGYIKKEYAIDFVVVNGENSSERGRGISSRIVKFFKHNGANVITSGNHIWQDREIYSYLQQNSDLLKPANFPNDTPGVGVTTILCKDVLVGVINVQGRIFMRENLSCPFRTVDTILTYLHHKTKIIIVDFHAEASSEKIGLGFYLDGRVSAVVGTHTHVPTADERILPGGTAFVTDLGMVGSQNSMLGMKKDPIIRHLITQMPVKFEVETSNPMIMTGVIVDVDTKTGSATAIERIKILDDDIHLNSSENA
ncbi:TIGR00282 family metallophosphoesterase [Candidatus Dependentiae bacterium]|nr:TIGR00282 family metallophosphoesterase [Candidatus Dependentiae bacterium]